MWKLRVLYDVCVCVCVCVCVWPHVMVMCATQTVILYKLIPVLWNIQLLMWFSYMSLFLELQQKKLFLNKCSVFVVFLIRAHRLEPAELLSHCYSVCFQQVLVFILKRKTFSFSSGFVFVEGFYLTELFVTFSFLIPALVPFFKEIKQIHRHKSVENQSVNSQQWVSFSAWTVLVLESRSAEREIEQNMLTIFSSLCWQRSCSVRHHVSC